MNRGQLLKWFVAEARKRSLEVHGGENGNGWVNVAMALGVDCKNKREARIVLEARLGSPSEWKEMAVIPIAATDAFLSSYAWRKLRMEAIKKYGARCQCCGAKPEHGVRIHVDHIKPRRKFPHLALALSNLQILCEECNHGKGNWYETDWRDRPGGFRTVMEHAAGPLVEIIEEQQKAHLDDIMH